MTKKLDFKLITYLEEKYSHYWWPVEYPKEVVQDPFKNLILTVLSQNTSEANCIKAYKGLGAKFKIDPGVLAKANIEDIKQAIRSGGLYNVKSNRIKELSKAILEKFDGNIASVIALPKEEARIKLTSLPGIGSKTADVLLATRLGYSNVTVIDTHFERITKRLGLVKQNAEYYETQKALNEFIPWEMGERISGLLWLLAKFTCRAKNPKCYECVLISLCDFADKAKHRKDLTL